MEWIVHSIEFLLHESFCMASSCCLTPVKQNVLAILLFWLFLVQQPFLLLLPLFLPWNILLLIFCLHKLLNSNGSQKWAQWGGTLLGLCHMFEEHHYCWRRPCFPYCSHQGELLSIAGCSVVVTRSLILFLKDISWVYCYIIPIPDGSLMVQYL